ncbi:MAG: class I SAM-dependent methyltransferase, partial [Pyrinomonadaceae bacterium]
GEVALDVGCGTGRLLQYIGQFFKRYVGVDLVRYDDFPPDAEFIQLDLDARSPTVPDGFADIVISAETIEHLENPRQFMRELTRMTKPGGWVIVTTPNQRSFLSLLTLIIKGKFNYFQKPDYPAHITALLEIDLERIAKECGLVEVSFDFSLHGRIVFTPKFYPEVISKLFPRAGSDTILLLARRPAL